MRHIYLLILWISSLTLTAQNNYDLERAIPEDFGISSETILAFINSAEEKIDAIHSLMIVKNDKVITEAWWSPYDQNTPHELWSLSKSFTSTAIGFAVQENLLSINDLVISFFPEKNPKDITWQLKELRVVDLLTMSTGHVKEPSIYREEYDWVSKFLGSEIKYMPGTHFMYNTPATYMLSAIIQKVANEKLVDYLYPRLFEPLGIDKPEWEEDPLGINVGGWGLHLKTEDIAKFGQLYLNNGNWNGNQILSEEWISSATSKQVSNGSNPNNDWTQGYGFQFWRSRYNSYRADGAMGQFCLVIPEKDMVIAITSGTNNLALIMKLVWDIILPNTSKTKLIKNDFAYNTLKKKISLLSLNPYSEKKPIKPKIKIINKKFQMESNEQGVKAISFKMGENENFVSIEMENETEIISFSYNTFIRNYLKTHLPFTRASRSQILPKSSLRYKKNKKIGSIGTWLNENEFELTNYLYETPVKMTYNFIFSDDALIVKSKAKNYLGVSNDEKVLKSINYE
jgi:CubicO group peptidase (beta-lactamase class C family)